MKQITPKQALELATSNKSRLKSEIYYCQERTNCMNLDSFIFEQLQRIEQFERFWRGQQTIASQNYPDEMTAGQWDEQLSIWKESNQDAR